MNYTRLKTSLYRLWYKHLSHTQHKIVRFKNAEFIVRPDNYIDRRMWVEKGYEKLQLNYLNEQAGTHSFDAFLDIGANFGLYSCIIGMSDLVPEQHSFECDPRNIYHLYAHLKMNNLTERVTVHDFAVGDKECDVRFQLATNDNTGKSYVGEGTDAGTYITVKQKPLDQILDYKGKSLLIKIDVEGYEEAVLKGMTDILSNNTCFIQMEILDDDAQRVGEFFPDGYKNVHQIGHDWYFSNL